MSAFHLCNMRESDLTIEATVTLLPVETHEALCSQEGGGELGMAIWTVHHLSLIQFSPDMSGKKGEDVMGSIFICVHSFFLGGGGIRLWYEKQKNVSLSYQKFTQCIFSNHYLKYRIITRVGCGEHIDMDKLGTWCDSVELYMVYTFFIGRILYHIQCMNYIGAHSPNASSD